MVPIARRNGASDRLEGVMAGYNRGGVPWFEEDR